MSDSIRHLVCPSCGALNRVSVTRPAQQAKCGKCHQALFTGKPAAADGTAFESHITRNDIPWWWISGPRGAGRAWLWHPLMSGQPPSSNRGFACSR